MFHACMEQGVNVVNKGSLILTGQGSPKVQGMTKHQRNMPHQTSPGIRQGYNWNLVMFSDKLSKILLLDFKLK